MRRTASDEVPRTARPRLIFLATIYETDPRQSDWNTGFKADLKQIAYDAVKAERYARHVKGKPPAETEGAKNEGERGAT